MPDTHSPSRPPELELLFACALWPQTEPDWAKIRLLVSGPLDWQGFLLLVQHHRLVPLTARNLQAALGDDTSAVPPAILAELRGRASANALFALRSLAELRRTTAAFAARDIQVRVLKGLPLALAAYGDIGLRSIGDIDLLIEPAGLGEADTLLDRLGYSGLFSVERFTPRQFTFYRDHWKDISYQNAASGFELDLHWRCFRNAAMPGNRLAAPENRVAVSFGSFEVATLPPSESLLYQCVHGTLDGWLYFKSLADIAAQVRPMSAAELDSLAGLAGRYGVLPELSAALLLVQRYFDLPCWSEGLLPAEDSTVAHILGFADRSLEGGNFLGGRDAISPSAMFAFELGLRPGLAYRRELALRVLYRARMWQSIPLPDWLFPAYPLLSPIEWLAFRLRRQQKPNEPSETSKM